MEFAVSIWDEKGFVQQGMIVEPLDVRIDRELNGNYILSFKTTPQLSYYSLLTFRKVIRLHDLTLKSVTTTITGSGTNSVTLSSVDNLELDDFIIIYNKQGDSVQKSCTDYFAKVKTSIAGAYTDETNDAKDDIPGNVVLTGTSTMGDALYIGDTLPYNVATIYVHRIALGSYEIAWEYYNDESNWVQLELDINEIKLFDEVGNKVIAFDAPSDWATVAIDGDTYYWIRARISDGSITQQALGTRIYLGYYGSNGKIQVNTASLTVNDYLRLKSDESDESIKIKSIHTSPLHYIIADVGHVHSQNVTLTSPGACCIARIKTINRSSKVCTLSRLDFTPETGSKVEFVNFTSFRLAEMTEQNNETSFTCNHISYDLNDQYFMKDGRYNLSFNPDESSPFVENKIDIDSLIDLILVRQIDSDGDPRKIDSFIRGNLYSIKYSEGTVNVINGSTVVNGSGVEWFTKKIAGGSLFVVEGDSTIYTVNYTSSETRLVLTSSIARSTAGNLKYLLVSRSVYDSDIYLTGTVEVEHNNDIVTLLAPGTWSAIETGATFRVTNDPNIYYTLQQRPNTTSMKLTKAIQRSSASGLSYWIDKDRREISFTGNTLRAAFIELAKVFSDDEWITWFEVNEDLSIDIIHRPIPFNGVDPTSSLIVEPTRNLTSLQKQYDDIEFGNVIIGRGATSGWENAFSGVTATVADDNRNSNTRIKLIDTLAMRFRNFDAIEILRLAQTITITDAAEKTITISPGQKNFLYDAPSYTDYTTEALNATLDDVPLLPDAPAVDDASYFGADYKWNRLGMNLTTSGVGVWVLIWEYYNGSSWDTITFGLQEISTFREIEESIQNIFEIPSDWARISISGENLYWIRARVSSYTSITTAPKAATCYNGSLIGDEYRNGRIVITSGNGVGQVRTIAYNDDTTFTMTRKWDDIPYASTALIAAKYSDPVHVRGFGYMKKSLTEYSAHLRRIECNAATNPIVTGEADAGSSGTKLIDITKNFTTEGVETGNYIYNADDYNNLTVLSAWAAITSVSTTTNPNDTLNFSGGLDEGDTDTFSENDRYVVVNHNFSIRSAYRGGIIELLTGKKKGSAYEIWGNDDISFISQTAIGSPNPVEGDQFNVIAPAQLVEQFDIEENGTTYPNFNDGGVGARFVQVTSASRYFQIDCFNGGRLYIISGDRAGDTYNITNTDGNSIFVSSWGTMPTDGDEILIIKETDLMLSVAKHTFTPEAGDSVLLLLYETGNPLTIGKYAEFRTTVASYDEDNNSQISKTTFTVKDASSFAKNQIIFIGAQTITTDLLFSMNRGSQIIGDIRAIANVDSNDITVNEELSTAPQPGDHVELIGLADADSIREFGGTVELVYERNDLTDPLQLYGYTLKFKDKVSKKPIPLFKVDFLSLYDIDPIKWNRDAYKIGDTIRVISQDLDTSTLRINQEVIDLAMAGSVNVEISTPEIVLTKMLYRGLVDEVDTRLDASDVERSFNRLQGRSAQCVYFTNGSCRKTEPPNSFCNTLESNRDGRLTKEGTPILKVHCQAVTAIEGSDPAFRLPTNEKFYASTVQSYALSTDDDEWHDLASLTDDEGAGFVITSVHLSTVIYDTGTETVIPAADAEVQVKDTVRVRNSANVDNGHGIIQGDDDGTGFRIEYKIAAGVSATAQINWWAWGYEG